MAELLVARRSNHQENVPVHGPNDIPTGSEPSASAARSNQTASDALQPLNLSSKSSPDVNTVRKEISDEAGKAQRAGKTDAPENEGTEFQGKLRPDTVEREVGPSIWTALAAGAYRLAGTPYSMPGTKTVGVDMGKKAVPGILKHEPEVRLGGNSGPVSVGFPLKDDAKGFVDEVRIVAGDGKTIVDKAKSTGQPGEFRFGGTDSQYPEGAFLVYKLSNGKSFHMSLRPEASAA